MITRFRDIFGRRYAIPDDVLREHEVAGELPAGQRVIGLEDAPSADASPQGDLVYRWTIVRTDDGDTREDLVTAPEKTDGST